MAKKKAAGRAAKMTYYFGKTRTEGRGVAKDILGGKGLNLAEMTGIGLPVPPGFTIIEFVIVIALVEASCAGSRNQPPPDSLRLAPHGLPQGRMGCKNATWFATNYGSKCTKLIASKPGGRTDVYLKASKQSSTLTFAFGHTLPVKAIP